MLGLKISKWKRNSSARRPTFLIQCSTRERRRTAQYAELKVTNSPRSALNFHPKATLSLPPPSCANQFLFCCCCCYARGIYWKLKITHNVNSRRGVVSRRDWIHINFNYEPCSWCYSTQFWIKKRRNGDHHQISVRVQNTNFFGKAKNSSTAYSYLLCFHWLTYKRWANVDHRVLAFSGFMLSSDHGLESEKMSHFRFSFQFICWQTRLDSKQSMRKPLGAYRTCARPLHRSNRIGR